MINWDDMGRSDARGRPATILSGFFKAISESFDGIPCRPDAVGDPTILGGVFQGYSRSERGVAVSWRVA